MKVNITRQGRTQIETQGQKSKFKSDTKPDMTCPNATFPHHGKGGSTHIYIPKKVVDFFTTFCGGEGVADFEACFLKYIFLFIGERLERSL